MAILYFAGFETGSLAEGIGASGVSIVTSGQRTGNYGLRCNPSGAATGSITIGQLSPTTGEVVQASITPGAYYGFAFNPVVRPATGEETICHINGPASSSTAYIKMTSTGILKLYASNGTTLIATGSTALSANTWYYIEFRVTAGTTQPYELRINGTTELSGNASFVTTASATGSMLLGKVTNTNSNTVDFYYDDAYISNTGFLATTTLFPQVKRKGPIGAGDSAGWTNGTGSTFAEVDEVPPESDGVDASYIQASATQDNLYTTFAMQSNASAGITGTIQSVMVDAWVRTLSTSGSSVAAVRMRNGGVNADSPSIEWTTSYVSKNVLRDTNPNGGAAWTLATLDTVQAGVTAGAIAQVQRCSAVCLHVLFVDKIPVIITPTTRALLLTQKEIHTQLDRVIGISSQQLYNFPRQIAWKTSLIGYAIMRISTGLQILKTTNGGNSWTALTTWTSFTIAQSLWADWWTSGNTGTLLHIWNLNLTTNDLEYRTLDTATDTLGTLRTTISATNVTNTPTYMTGTRSRDGRMGTIIYNSGTDFTEGFYTSDDGITWTLRASPLIGTQVDQYILLPGNESDPKDMWLIHWDTIANSLLFKVFDDSANSWSSTTIATSMNDAAYPTQFAAAIRWSDGHLILVAWNQHALPSATLRCWDINGAGSITLKSTVVTAATLSHKSAISIDQNTDEIYVYYFGKEAGGEGGTFVKVYYKKSTDGGTSWSTEILIGSNPGDSNAVIQADHGSRNFRIGVAHESASTSAPTYWTYPNSIAIEPPSLNRTATPGTASLVTAPFIPQARAPRLVTPAPIALNESTLIPSIKQGFKLTPPVRTLVDTQFIPTAPVSANQKVIPGVRALVDSQFVPTIQTPQQTIPGKIDLLSNLLAPTAKLALTSTPPARPLVLTPLAPYIPLDILVDSNLGLLNRSWPRLLAFKTENIGYFYYVDGATSDLIIKKTTNGGRTWSIVATVSTGSARHWEIWADWWTAGNTGTKIHCCYLDNGTADYFYREFDTNGDTLGTERTVVAGTAVGGNQWQSTARSREGRIGTVIADNGADFAEGFYTSDDGITWTVRANPLEGIVFDQFVLLPANTADPRDMWLIFWDESTNEWTLKTYNATADSWSESATFATGVFESSTPQFNAAVRWSDGHAIWAAHVQFSAATSDLRVFDINGAGSITELTPVFTDTDQVWGSSVQIDQNNNDIYVWYVSGPTDAAANIYYKKSTDDGATWGAAVQYSQDPPRNSYRMWTDPGSTNFRIGAIWPDESAANDAYYNYNNSIAVLTALIVTPSPLALVTSLLAPVLTPKSLMDAILADAPKGYWPLGEDDPEKPAVDYSGLGHDGTYINSPAVAQTSLVPSTSRTSTDFEFTSDQHVVVTKHADFDVADSFTLECVIRIESLTEVVHEIFTNGANSFELRVAGYNGGRVELCWHSHSIILTTTITLATNTNYHIIATKNGSDMHIYVNGVDVSTGHANATLTDSTDPLNIGRYTGISTYSWDGRLQDAAVYDYALTAQQIANHYFAYLGQVATLAPTPSPLALVTSLLTLIPRTPRVATPVTTALNDTMLVPTVRTPKVVQLPAATALSDTQFTPTITAPRRVTPGVLAHILTGLVPSVKLHKRAVPGLAALTDTLFAPIIGVGQRATVGLLALATAGFAPVIILPKLATILRLHHILSLKQAVAINPKREIPARLPLVLTRFDAQTGGSKSATISTNVFLLNRFNPTITAHQKYILNRLPLTISLKNAVSSAPRLNTINKASLLLNEQSVEPSVGLRTSPAILPVILGEQVVGVSAPRMVTVGRKPLVLAGFGITAGNPRLATVNRLAVALLASQPVLSMPVRVSLNPKGILATGLAPTTIAHQLATPGRVQFLVQSFTPGVRTPIALAVSKRSLLTVQMGLNVHTPVRQVPPSLALLLGLLEPNVHRTQTAAKPVILIEAEWREFVELLGTEGTAFFESEWQEFINISGDLFESLLEAEWLEWIDIDSEIGEWFR